MIKLKGKNILIFFMIKKLHNLDLCSVVHASQKEQLAAHVVLSKKCIANNKDKGIHSLLNGDLHTI